MRVESSDATEASTPGQLDQIWTSGDQYGRVAYTHGAAIDRPLDIVKDNQLIIPHYNWRGLAEMVTDDTGALLCPNTANCPTTRLPGSYATAFRGMRDNAGSERDWWGSLIVDQLDQSGLLYRRNRYHDPVAGTFTQEDPIGLDVDSSRVGVRRSSDHPEPPLSPVYPCPRPVRAPGGNLTILNFLVIMVQFIA